MEKLLKKIRALAKKHPKKIVFPESQDPRILKAVKIILQKRYASVILIGKKKVRGAITIAPSDSPYYDKFVKRFYTLRKKKGMTLAKAKELMKDPIYFATMLVKTGKVDGMVSGSLSPTATTVRAALQIIGAEKKFHKVSGMFIMILKKRWLFFADTAVTINPDAKDLAGIAIDTAETAKQFGIKPKIAMLSFSTKDSAKHPFVNKVKEATAIVKSKKPKLKIDGEVQVDTALVSQVAKLKCPKCRIKGDANVLIFPDLQSGNISYKLVERLAKAHAVGPILQGLKKPVNDLSRSCSVEDIVDVTCITILQAGGKFR